MRIPLGAVSGPIDHLAIGLKRQRLCVAKLGNNSLGVVDLASGKVLQTVAGFKEPQGVGYGRSTDTIYIANAADGSVHVLRGQDLASLGHIAHHQRADRCDAPPGVGGLRRRAVAIIDPVSRAKIDDVRLPAHPESFQLIEDGARAAANLPDVHQIGIVDLARGAVRTIPTGALAANFPMTVDAAARRILIVFRSPPTLAAYTIPQGQVAAKLPICADADDLFVDAKSHRVYVSCGAGVVDVLEPAAAGCARVAQVSTTKERVHGPRCSSPNSTGSMSQPGAS